MNAATEAQTYIRDIAGPQPIGGKVKSALARVAEMTGISERRIRGIWNGERVVRVDDLQALKDVRDALIMREARAERAKFVARMAQWEEALRVRDEDFHRNEIDAFRGLRGDLDRPVDGGADSAD